ncbi:MAG: Three-deoxy-D-manno-octulosonic-acid transferase protein [Edaphobacter sp.]|nr:Three-deoxy-D-manno-octulosonic-acid transferase protein [Edaphobacter sp.]
MIVYSFLLLAALVLGAPYWLLRMATSGRYRAGLAGRLGVVPKGLRAAVAGRDVVWVHAVSVGEVVAATRLVGELEAALGDGWVVVVSTTTATGQALARERFGAERVFFYPLDLGWAVRAYLKALRPRMLVLMESELWPRMLVECERVGVPVAVVNARVSDRSFARGVRVRALWQRMLRRVTLFLVQSDEDARRLTEMGARSDAVRVTGNLKYDVRAPKQSRVAEIIRVAVGGRPLVVAGSTVEGREGEEERLLMQYWPSVLKEVPEAVIVVAPRHPERFAAAHSMMKEYGTVRATELLAGAAGTVAQGGNILLDTIGDLAAVYELASVAFVGGSLVRKGGHNPLEAARFGVPVVMGPSYENFRDAVERMRAADGILVVQNGEEFEAALIDLLKNGERATAIGEHGRAVFDAQAGATARTVQALTALLQERSAATR